VSFETRIVEPVGLELPADTVAAALCVNADLARRADDLERDRVVTPGFLQISTARRARHARLLGLLPAPELPPDSRHSKVSSTVRKKNAEKTQLLGR